MLKRNGGMFHRSMVELGGQISNQRQGVQAIVEAVDSISFSKVNHI